MKSIRLWIIVAVLCALTGSAVMGQSNPAATQQTPSLMLDEARVVYLGNLERRARGIPPLRWNRQLTNAARWFSWDSTENRPEGFCGHQDSAGNWPVYRARAFGYLGLAGAENAYCGYMTPEDATQGWMNSPGHRANLLDPNSREIGVGYYRRADGRGYIAQMFGNDPVYAPVVIENEAITTQTPNVNLYIYDRSPGDGFASLGAATHMMISNSPCFAGATWEPYAANRSWTLESGEGWRQVNVRTRDVFGRTLTVSDTIYLGAHAPLDEMNLMSSNQAQVTIYNATDGASGAVQLSAGWLADTTFSTFQKLWGNGEPINGGGAGWFSISVIPWQWRVCGMGLGCHFHSQCADDRLFPAESEQQHIVRRGGADHGEGWQRALLRTDQTERHRFCRARSVSGISIRFRFHSQC